MNEYKHSDELKKLIERLDCNIDLNENGKRIIIVRLLDELYYRVQKYGFVAMSDEEYSHYYDLLQDELS